MFGFLKKKGDTPVPSEEPTRSAPETGDWGVFDFELDASLQSDVGCIRELNEDSGIIIRPDDPTRKTLLVAVADGMGGHQAGEVASRTAVEVVSRDYHEANDDPHARLKKAFEHANQEIYAQGQKSETFKGMGTTCTALAIENGRAYAAHVGDSRIYLIRGGEIYVMTEDHSAVMELVKQGALTLEEARHHADKNVIIRAMGSRPSVEVSVWKEPFPLRLGDEFVVCSDGLHDRIEDAEIRNITTSRRAAEACASLIRLAKERGGYDNITVAVVKLARPSGPDSKVPPPTREVEVIE
jgi:protein phosphatase